MITLKNGFQFSVAAASGALAYGRGWWWDRYGLIPLGWVQPGRVAIITKTLTLDPRRGNLRWYAPWRAVSVRWRGGSVVNAVGLTNPGWEWWRSKGYQRNCVATGRDVIVSVAPADRVEAAYMGFCVGEQMPHLRAVELNASCPNVAEPTGSKVKWVCSVFDAISRTAGTKPVGVKLGVTDPYLEIVRELDGRAAWFSLINSVPWDTVNPGTRSPLEGYPHGQKGGVSGPDITALARVALTRVRDLKPSTPLLAGGGLMTAPDAAWRMANGASAVQLGTVYLTRPWRVNGIIDAVELAERPDAADTVAGRGRA